MIDGTERGVQMWRWIVGVSFLIGAGTTLASADQASWRAPATAEKRENPVADSSQAIAAGKRLFERECTSCHGKQGHGDGPAAVYLGRSLGNFADATWTKTQTDGELFWKISEGRSPMPSFRQRLTEEQRWQIVRYIRTLSASAKNK